MGNEYKYLYLLTGIMLLMFVILILFIAWASKKLSDQNKLILHRDKRWGERIENVERLVRTEFALVLNELKKL